MVVCKVGDGCDAIRCVVLCAVMAGATEALTHWQVMYNIDTGQVNAPGFVY